MRNEQTKYENYKELAESAALLKKVVKSTCNEDISFEKALLCVALEQHIGEYIMYLSEDIIAGMSDTVDEIKNVSCEIYRCCT